jgi:PAS domain S-box-containing protein
MDEGNPETPGRQVDQAVTGIARALISPSGSIEDISHLVLGHAKKITGSSTGYIALIDRETGKIISHSLTAPGGIGCLTGAGTARAAPFMGSEANYRGLWGECLRTGKGFYTNAASSHPSSCGVPAGHLTIEKFLSVPAFADHTLMGQIALANPGRDYTDEDLAAVGALSDLFALALRHRYFTLDLRDREDRIRAILAATKNALVILDQEGRILDINEPMAARIGKTREALIDTIVFELVPAGAISRRMGEEIRQGLMGKTIRYNEEYRGIWPDNSIFALPGPGGRSPMVAVYSHDITDTKLAEFRLREINEELNREREQLLISSTIIETMDDSVLFTNLVGKIQYINRSCSKRLGYALEEIQGKDIGEFQYPGDAFVLGPTGFLDDKKGIWTGMLSLKNRYGLRIRTSLKSTPVIREDNIVGRIFVLREIL